MITKKHDSMTSKMPDAPSNLHVFDDSLELSRSAARLIENAAQCAVRERGRFTLVLSGGTTPRRLFEHVARHQNRDLPWQRTHLFWSDERFVPPDHPHSNFALAEATLLPHLHIPPTQIHRVPTERASHESSAIDYEVVLRNCFPHRDTPAFDLVLLGLGADGHTASLFPGFVPDPDRWVQPVTGPPDRPPIHRITMTYTALNGARTVAFLVTGVEKHAALRAVIDSPDSHPEFPAAHIQPQERLEWFVDRAAYEGG